MPKQLNPDFDHPLPGSVDPRLCTAPAIQKSIFGKSGIVCLADMLKPLPLPGYWSHIPL
jgi:hypothetical protein